MPGKTKPKPTNENIAEQSVGKQWYNPTEAADYLGISRFTLYKLMDDGIVPFYTLEGVQKRRLKKDDLDALFKKGSPSKKAGS